jgi:type IV pilus assembly protein PilW
MRAMSKDARGFSLIELLIASGVTVVLILGAASLLLAQQATFRSTSSERAVQETGRIALEHIAGNLRRAGFGVDPGLAFDFGAQATARMDRAFAGGTFATSAFACGTAVSCRDRINGPDELVFLSRDPAFGHALVTAGPTASSTTLTMQGPLLQPLHKGQILQVMCYSGQMTWAYVTVDGEVAATTDPAAPVTFPIVGGSSSTTFPVQNSLFADACFRTVATTGNASTVFAAAKVFKVDRYRYFIQSHAADGSIVAWGTPGSRPWLMLDQGLQRSTANDMIEVIAPDVEDLQAAYVFPLDATNTIAGAAPGTALPVGATGINLSVAPPIYSEDVAAGSRLTHHPANIRAVRLGLIVRSAEPTSSLSNAATLPALLNRPSMSADDGYRRQPFETTIAVRNMDARAPYFPVWEPGSLTLNIGGG